MLSNCKPKKTSNIPILNQAHREMYILEFNITTSNHIIIDNKKDINIIDEVNILLPVRPIFRPKILENKKLSKGKIIINIYI